MSNHRATSKEKDVWEEYPEVWHYTDKPGLEGIIKSKSIWATYILDTDDSSEGRSSRQLVIEKAIPLLRQQFVLMRKKNEEFDSLIKSKGGLENITKYEAEIWFDGRFKQLLKITKPFITSFCYTKEEDQEDGLLSQWRAYGKNSGYALIFDTQKLWEACKKSMEHIKEANLMFLDVFYTQKDINKRFRKEMESMASNTLQFYRYRGEQNPFDGKDYSNFIKIVAGTKHVGYREEQEVRFFFQQFNPKSAIEIPDKKIRESVSQLSNVVSSKPERVYLGGNDEFLSSINRIMVGPHKNKEKYAESVSSLLQNKKLNIPVSISTIPFLGMR